MKNLRKKLLLFISIFALLTGFLHTEPAEAANYGLNKTSLSIYTGKTSKLSVSGVYGTIKWSSSNRSVATVSSSGTVKGIKAGKVKITATVGYSKFTCNVTVKNPSLSTSRLTMVKGKSCTIKLNGTTIKKAASSNKAVATVTVKGKIAAKKNGTCKLTFTGANGKKYVCSVKVETPALSKTSVRLLTGQTASISLNKNTQKVTWSSGNKNIAAVDSKGKITAKAQGAVNITAKVNTASYTCTVVVVKEADTYTKAEWVRLLLKELDISVNKKTVNYYYSDTKSNPYGAAVETAYACGIIPDSTYAEDVPKFSPNATVTREFAAVTAVRAMGYRLQSGTRPSCSDSYYLKYPEEDYIAVSTGLLPLKNNYFYPDDPFRKNDRTVMSGRIQSMNESLVNVTPKDETTYTSGVIKVEQAPQEDYQLTDHGNGTYTVILPDGETAKTIYSGRTFILPVTKTHPTQLALRAVSVSRRSDGKIEVSAVKPEKLEQVVTSIDFAGTGTVIPEKIEKLQKGITCTYIPEGKIAPAQTAEYQMSNYDMDAAAAVIGGEVSMPGKLHFNLGNGISLGKKGKLKGEFEYEIPNITAKIDIDCGWSGIKINEATATITQKAKITGKVEYVAAESEMAPGASGTQELARVPFSLGGTGLSLDVVVSLFYDAKGNVSVVCTAEARDGVQYKDGNFRIISDLTASIDLPSVQASAKMGLQGALNIVAFEIWDIIGVEAQVGPAVNASIKNHATENLICADATLYAYMQVGLNEETLLGDFVKNKLHYVLEKKLDENSSMFKLKLHFENGKKVAECTYGKGKISGYVYDVKTEKAISGARVVLSRSGMEEKNVYTDSSGKYTIDKLSPGTYTLKVSATDYSTFDVKQEVKKNVENYVESALMLLREEKEPAWVQGSLIDGVTGYRLSGVTLKVRKGWGQTSGTIIKSLNASSGYSFEIEPGHYTIQAALDGYVSDIVNITAVSNQTIQKDITLVPKNSGTSSNKLRVVLTWGYTPYDLDAHLFGPVLSGSGSFHTYWSNKNYYYNGETVANLDLDDRYSYGPETTTLTKTKKSGTYSFYVHDYTNRNLTNSKYLSASGAKVVVYLNGKLAATFYVPANKGGTAWHVFDYNAASKQIVPRNKMYYTSLPSTMGRASAAADGEALSILSQLEELGRMPEKESQDKEASNETIPDKTVQTMPEDETPDAFPEFKPESEESETEKNQNEFIEIEDE